MGSEIELYKSRSKWNAHEVAVATVSIERDQYRKLVAEWAEVIYLNFCQLPENSNSLALELLPLPILAEKVEVADAA